MGGERYAHRFWSDESLNPSDFEQERFFSQQDGDTFYDIRDAAWHPQKRAAWSQVRFIGDKLPLAYMRLPVLAREFPGAKVIVMIRNIFDVASSYQKRDQAEDGDWQGGGIEQAVFDWNQLFAKLQQAPVSLALLPVAYERLFIQGDDVDRLISFIGLKNPAPLRDALAVAHLDGRSLENDRSRGLSALDAALICANADFDGYRRTLMSDPAARLKLA